MLKTEEGIITRTVKYGETSVILDLLTKNEGVKSFIVSGVRTRGNKNKASLVRVLNIVKIEAYSREDDKLSRIKEIAYLHVYKSIPFNVIKASIATFLIEVCRKSIKATDDSKSIYNYVVKGLVHLDNSDKDIAHFHFKFLIGLAKQLGFAINNNFNSENKYFDLKDGTFKPEREEHRYCLDEESSMYLHSYLSEDDIDKISRKNRQTLILNLVNFYKYHIDDFGDLKSLDILISLYEG